MTQHIKIKICHMKTLLLVAVLATIKNTWCWDPREICVDSNLYLTLVGQDEMTPEGSQ